MSEPDQRPDMEDYAEQEYEAADRGGDQPEHKNESAQDDEHIDTPEEQLLPINPLSQLPVTLSLRCGSLSLTFEQLRRLGIGTVLEVHGVTPGNASLCNGEQIVAEGELVDVGGRLGLQITRMASTT